MPTTRVRPDPVIPDHEVLRRIGGGAYGEVWLARGVTGALRAVKVLWREDFEDERSFEREFEGILKYEPISRDHPGLVDILHVGRGDAGFYYYVMELGDDIASGGEINAVEYEARTLRNDITRAGGKGLGTDFCLDVGLRLAEALRHLHDSGLAHRDVKPANVIFVNGKAKLADIGLVAARGQRTFVGTEGFVPPEGPGSAQADVYSLGKVLYEAATGRDRLDFPELPDELPTGAERKRWLALNQIICEICEPHFSRRAIKTAGELAEALGHLQAGKNRRRRRRRGNRSMAGVLSAMVFGGAAMWGAWEAGSRAPWTAWLGIPPLADPEPVEESEPRRAYLKVTSTPDQANVIDVVDESGMGELIGQTPTDVLEAYVGEEISLRILRDGYRPYEVTATIPETAVEEPFTISAVLEVFAPPVLNEPWLDQFGREFRPLGDGHESVEWVAGEAWRTFVEAEERDPKAAQLLSVRRGDKTREVVVTSEAEARAYCDWLVQNGIAEGYLTEDHEALPQMVEDFSAAELNRKARGEGWKPFKVLVRPIPYGRVMVETRPEGAEIYVDGESEGTSDGPLLIDRLRPGSVALTASREGYKSETRRLEIGPGETLDLTIKLREDRSVVFDREWENSLGMKLMPVGDSWMAAAHETRRVDYAEFVQATGATMPPPPDWLIDPGERGWQHHPVVSVSREDAEAFCRWLNEKERADNRIKPSQEYRLPTDFEWSFLVGLDEPFGVSPATRDRLKPRIFPWGDQWPPANFFGNYADQQAEASASRRIPGYLDGFPATAPVGSFEVNEFGLYDLSGNAQEWVSDAYSSLPDAEANGLLRGGGWRSFQESALYLGARNPQPPDAINGSYGFRVVLAKIPLDKEPEDERTLGGDGENGN